MNLTNECLFSKFEALIELAEHIKDIVKKFRLVKIIKVIEKEREALQEFLNSDRSEEEKKELLAAQTDIIIDVINLSDIGDKISHRALYALQDHIKED